MTAEGAFARLKADVAAIARRSGHRGGVRYVARYLLLQPAFHYVLWWRAQEAAATIPIVGGVVRRLIWFIQSLMFSSEISPRAQIGGGLYLPHPYAIVVGDGAIVGSNVAIYQGVTIGQRGDIAPAMARIGDDVYIGAGAVILGGVTIGNGAIIGANAVVLQDIPAGARAVGNPARILSPDRAVEPAG